MMKPWHGKVKQCKIVLECCPPADAMAWLRRGGPLQLPPIPANVNGGQQAAVQLPPSPSPSPPPPLEIFEANDDEQQAVAIQGNPSNIQSRRQSTSGGALFSVNNEVWEMGADYLRRVLATSMMIVNRFDPFQRLSNGPLRSRSRSADNIETLAIREVDEDDKQ